MLGTLFIALIITLILGAVLASANDEIHHVWFSIIDYFHRSPTEQHYKQLRQSQHRRLDS